MHPCTLPPEIVERVIARRGRLHPFERLDPARTALAVIDMQNVFMAPGAPIEVPAARAIVPAINRLARACRGAGALVAWVSMTVRDQAEWPVFLDSIVAPAAAARILPWLQPGSDGNRLWPALETEPGDLFVAKNRFSAFLPGASPLPGLLKQRGIEYVLVAGTLTNVCCESSARDAAMQDFRVTMVADANACRSDAEHLAALATFIQSFGDVRTADETIALLARAAPGRAGAA